MKKIFILYVLSLVSFPLFASAKNLHCSKGEDSLHIKLLINPSSITGVIVASLDTKPEITLLPCYAETELVDGFYICQSLQDTEEGFRLEFYELPMRNRMVDIYKYSTNSSVLLDSLPCK